MDNFKLNGEYFKKFLDLYEKKANDNLKLASLKFSSNNLYNLNLTPTIANKENINSQNKANEELSPVIAEDAFLR